MVEERDFTIPFAWEQISSLQCQVPLGANTDADYLKLF